MTRRRDVARVAGPPAAAARVPWLTSPPGRCVAIALILLSGACTGSAPPAPRARDSAPDAVLADASPADVIGEPDADGPDTDGRGDLDGAPDVPDTRDSEPSADVPTDPPIGDAATVDVNEPIDDTGGDPALDDALHDTAGSADVADASREVGPRDVTEAELPPAVPVRAMGAAGTRCRLESDGRLSCSGDNDVGQASPPPGVRFVAFDLRARWGCGVLIDRSVRCWGAAPAGIGAVPAPPFVDLACGDAHCCGIRPDRSVLCWGDSGAGRLDAPAGEYLEIDVAEHACALRSDGRATCWGPATDVDALEAPDEQVDALSVATGRSCFVRSQDGAIACVGAAQPVPDGVWRRVAVDGGVVCGLPATGDVACAADPPSAPGATPPGSFDARRIASGPGVFCAITTGDEVVCWP